MISILTGCSSNERITMYDYESNMYNIGIYEEEFFSSDLAVTREDTSKINFNVSEDIYGIGLFDVSNGIVYYGNNLFEPFYPASTTKVLTAYIALKYGNLDDEIVVTEEDLDIPDDSSVCELQVGDTLTLRDLLSGLILQSGNDNAMVIARYISGDIETFAKLMEEEASALGATQSSFANPHGYQDVEHYTTVYDLYLIFNAAIKNDEFINLISLSTYDTVITQSDGTERNVTWNATNYYTLGNVPWPENLEVIGGKTGFTSDARYCLVALEQDSNDNYYIAIVLGSLYRDLLYQEATTMAELIPNT